METPKLEPCPFCGLSEYRYLLYVEGGDFWKVQCDNDEASIEGDSDIQAMTRWNTRNGRRLAVVSKGEK